MANTQNLNSMKAPSRMQAIVGGRCPSCRKGPVFRFRLFTVTPEFLDAHANCPHCGVTYEPEPGFFWGSMYFNYAFNVATIAIVSVLVYFVFQASSPWAYIVPIILTVVLTIPFTTRISRMMWLHFFGPFRFDPEKFKASGRAA